MQKAITKGLILGVGVAVVGEVLGKYFPFMKV